MAKLRFQIELMLITSAVTASMDHTKTHMMRHHSRNHKLAKLAVWSDGDVESFDDAKPGEQSEGRIARVHAGGRLAPPEEMESAIEVTCSISTVAEDCIDSSNTGGHGVVFSACLSGDNKVFYIQGDDNTKSFRSNDQVTLKLKEVAAPDGHGCNPTGSSDMNAQFWEVEEVVRKPSHDTSFLLEKGSEYVPSKLANNIVAMPSLLRKSTTATGNCTNDPSQDSNCKHWAKEGFCDDPEFKVWLHEYCCGSCGPAPPVPAPSPPCERKDTPQYALRCPGWKEYCLPGGNWSSWMMFYCTETCENLLGQRKCADKLSECPNWRNGFYCDDSSYEKYMAINCCHQCCILGPATTAAPTTEPPSTEPPSTEAPANPSTTRSSTEAPSTEAPSNPTSTTATPAATATTTPSSGTTYPPNPHAKEMIVLTILLHYDDEIVDYTSPENATRDLYAAPEDYEDKSKYPGSMSDMVQWVSRGRLLLPREKGKTIITNMGANWRDASAGCPYWAIALEARNKTREQHPDVNLSAYSYFEFFLPAWNESVNNTPSCNFGGLAIVGCGFPSFLPITETTRADYACAGCQCMAWYREPGPFVRAHELGHNLGLLSAGGDAFGTFSEYGDGEASMGATYNFSSFTVSARYQLGWLDNKAGEVLAWDANMTAPIEIGSMSAVLNMSRYVGVKMACWACTAKVKITSTAKENLSGGNVWVSFRGDEGYSAITNAGMEPKYQNKVMVHFARAFAYANEGAGSELWATLDVGESYTPDHFDHTIHVCSIEGDVACVTIGVDGASAKSNCPGASAETDMSETMM